MTDDEKLAIFIYTAWNWKRFDFLVKMRDILIAGWTGRFNSYFEYVLNWFMKIKPDYKEEHPKLYRGTKNDIHNIYKTYNQLKEGEILKSRSFTSTTYLKDMVYCLLNFLLVNAYFSKLIRIIIMHVSLNCFLNIWVKKNMFIFLNRNS